MGEVDINLNVICRVGTHCVLHNLVILKGSKFTKYPKAQSKLSHTLLDTNQPSTCYGVMARVSSRLVGWLD